MELFLLSYIINIITMCTLYTYYVQVYNNILFFNICLRVSHVVTPKLMTLSSLRSSGRWLGLLG